MRYSLLLPVISFGLAGCAVSSEGPQPVYGSAYVAPVEVAPVIVARPVLVVR